MHPLIQAIGTTDECGNVDIISAQPSQISIIVGITGDLVWSKYILVEFYVHNINNNVPGTLRRTLTEFKF